MRILLQTQLFDPENAIKGLSFAKALVLAGHEVEVVTTFPNYPGGKLFPGYRMRLLQRDVIDGVAVTRVPMYISHGHSSLKRLLGYATFSAAAFFYGAFAARRPDVIYAYYPPVVGGVSAGLLGLIKRCPMIYDVQDLWPEAVVATGMVKSKRVENIIESLVGWVYRRAAAVVVLSDGYKNALIAKGVPAGKVTRIYNWCDESRICSVHDGETAVSDSFDIVYAGNMGAAQSLGHVLDAAQLLQARGENRPRFVLIGDGIEKASLQKKAHDLGLTNVQFIPRVSPEEIGAYLQRAGALLVHLAADPVFSITVPSKTQAYLAAGRPLLMAVDGESAEIVSRSGAGMVAASANPEEIARCALELSRTSRVELDAMGQAGRMFYQQNMSQNNGVAAISALIKQVTADAA